MADASHLVVFAVPVEFTEERFRQLMLSSGDMANDVGSIVYGEEAVAEGLMDRVGTLSDALNALYRQMEQ